jgi:hypothetical protein
VISAQNLSRHAGIQVTMTICAHASRDDQRKALDQLAELATRQAPWDQGVEDGRIDVRLPRGCTPF